MDTNSTTNKILLSELDNLESEIESLRAFYNKAINESRPSEKDIIKSSEMWRAVFDGIKEPIFLLNPDGIILQANKASEITFNKKINNLVGLHCHKVVHKSDSHIENCPLIRMKVSRQRETMILKVDNKSFEIVVDPILDKSNEIIGIVHIIYDVTESLQKEENLKVSESQLQALINNSNESIWSMDSSYNLIICNDYFKQSYLAAYNVELKVGINLLDILSDELKAFWKSKYDATLEGRKTKFEFKETILGNTFYFDVFLNPIIYEEQIIGVTSLSIDITERKHAEQKLRESEDRYRDLIENSSDLICTHDLDGNLLSVNKAALNITGYSQEEVLKMNMRNILAPDYRRFFNAYLEKIKSLGHADGLMIVQTKSGERRIWEYHNTLRTDDISKPIVRGMTKDVTDLKHAEASLKELVNELTQSNEEKNKLFSIIAHDLRNPLHGFLSLTKIMSEEVGVFSQEELTKIGKEMYQTADNIGKLLKNLLEWAQMQKGAINFEPEHISLSDLIAENVISAINFGRQKNILVVNEITSPVHVYADGKMINSVLLNLLYNAVKFTPRGGTVTVKANEIQNQMVEIAISDSGIGIQNDIIDKLFKIGERTNRKGTEGELSTGLGLLLCKEFVEKNGGKIWAESEVGLGSTFYFTLPSCRE